MNQKKLDRINELARKAKTPEGLTPEELAEAVENGTITQERLHDALARIEKMKSGLKFPEKCPDTQAEFAKNRELAKYACEKALTVIGSAEDLRCNEDEKFLLLAPPPVALTLVDEQIGEAHLAKTVGETYRNAKCIEYPIPMDDATLKELCKEMESFDKIIIGTYNAHTELSDMVKTVKERDPAAKSSAEIRKVIPSQHHRER